MKWWLSEQRRFPSSQLASSLKTWLSKERQKSSSSLDSLREARKTCWVESGDWDLWEASDRGCKALPLGSQGLGEVCVPRPIYMTPLVEFCGKPRSLCSDCGDTWWEREGEATARYCGGQRRRSLQTTAEKGNPDLGFEIHCLDKPMTMDRKNKRKSLENCICELN